MNEERSWILVQDKILVAKDIYWKLNLSCDLMRNMLGWCMLFLEIMLRKKESIQEYVINVRMLKSELLLVKVVA